MNHGILVPLNFQIIFGNGLIGEFKWINIWVLVVKYVELEIGVELGENGTALLLLLFHLG